MRNHPQNVKILKQYWRYFCELHVGCDWVWLCCIQRTISKALLQLQWRLSLMMAHKWCRNM